MLKPSAKELAYRAKNFQDIRAAKDRKLICGSCGNPVVVKPGKVFSHPLIEILQCEKCLERLQGIDFTESKDLQTKHCCICGSDTKLFLCGRDDCPFAFCEKCIKRNTNLSLLDADKEGWNCFICDTKPLWRLRAICATVVEPFSKRSKRKRHSGQAMKAAKGNDGLRRPTARWVTHATIREKIQSLCDSSSTDSSISSEKMRTSFVPSTENRLKSQTPETSTENSGTGKAAYSRRTTKSRTTHETKHHLKKKRKSTFAAKSFPSDVTEESEDNDNSRKSMYEEYSKSKKQLGKNDLMAKGVSKYPRRSQVDEESGCSKIENQPAYKGRVKKKNSVRSSTPGSSTEGQVKIKQAINRNYSHLVGEESNSSSGKEFQKSKLHRNRRHTFKRLDDIGKDYTMMSISQSNPFSFDQSDDKTICMDDHTTMFKAGFNKIVNKFKEACSDCQLQMEHVKWRYFGKEQISGKYAYDILQKSKGVIDQMKLELAAREKELSNFYLCWKITQNKTSPSPQESDLSTDNSMPEREDEVKNKKNSRKTKKSGCEEDPSKSGADKSEIQIDKSDNESIKSANTSSPNRQNETSVVSDFDSEKIFSEDEDNNNAGKKDASTSADKSSVKDVTACVSQAKRVASPTIGSMKKRSLRISHSTDSNKVNSKNDLENKKTSYSTDVLNQSCADLFDDSPMEISEKELEEENDQVENSNHEDETGNDEEIPSKENNPDIVLKKDNISRKETPMEEEKTLTKVSIPDANSCDSKSTTATEEIDNEKKKSLDKSKKGIPIQKKNSMDTDKISIKLTSVPTDSDESNSTLLTEKLDQQKEKSKDKNEEENLIRKKMSKDTKETSTKTLASNSEDSGEKNDGEEHSIDKGEKERPIVEKDSTNIEQTSNKLDLVTSNTEDSKEKKSEEENSADEGRKKSPVAENDSTEGTSTKLVVPASNTDDSAEEENSADKVETKSSNQENDSTDTEETSIKLTLFSSDSEDCDSSVLATKKNKMKIKSIQKKKSKDTEEETAKLVLLGPDSDESDSTFSKKKKHGSSDKAAEDDDSAKKEDTIDKAENSAKLALLASDTEDSDVSFLNEKNNEPIDKIEENSTAKEDSTGKNKTSSKLSAIFTSDSEDCESATGRKIENKSESTSENKEDEAVPQKDWKNTEEKSAKLALLASDSEDSDSSASNKIVHQSNRDNHDNREISSKLALLNSDSDDTGSNVSIEKKSEDKGKMFKTNISPLFSNSETLSSESENDSIGKRLTRSNTSNSLKRKKSPDFENSVGTRVKRRRFDVILKNFKDDKLGMSCQVNLIRMDPKILKKCAKALKASRKRLEVEKLKSLIDLNNIERKLNCKTMDTSPAGSPSQKKEKMLKRTEETLLDHLEKVQNGEHLFISDQNSNDENSEFLKDVPSPIQSNKALLLEADSVIKKSLLDSSDSDVGSSRSNANQEEDASSSSGDDKSKSEETEKNKKKEKKIEEEKCDESSEENHTKQDKSKWRRNKLLTMKLSDTDSEAEKKKCREKNSNDLIDASDNDDVLIQRKRTRRRGILDSDSDVQFFTSDSSSDITILDEDSNDRKRNAAADKKIKKRPRRNVRGGTENSDSDSSDRGKRSRVKRKRISTMTSDSDSDENPLTSSQGSPGKKGRKNIRKVMKDKQVADDTKQAAKEEEERMKRIADRQKLYNEMYEARLAGEEKVDKLVLDFDPESKEEFVSVNKEIVKSLKPHQAKGIKFMWDACFESLERIKTSSGSGCIIAHCMGLGKTLQVIALTHTLLTHEETGVRTVLIVCPLSTVLNWVNEFKHWLKDIDEADDIEIYHLTRFKTNVQRKYQLKNWQSTGGVFIIGYEMFRNLSAAKKNIRKSMKEEILSFMVNPGADVVVCDEGHLLKNEDTALSKAMKQVKTMRRIVLTGTPLQNNLVEYHCMVQFVKPKLLGTKKEFLNRFVNPITNGQFDNSTESDVKLMKKRAYVLHKMLVGCVQRFDYSVLTPFLPPKQEYVIFVCLSDVQIKMYQYYLENLSRRTTGGGTLFSDFQMFQRIWTHPLMLKLNAEKIEKLNEKRGNSSSDTEGSLRNFIDDGSTSDSSTSTSSSSDDQVEIIDDLGKDDRNKDSKNDTGNEDAAATTEDTAKDTSGWWLPFVQPEDFQDIRLSAKLTLLFGILRESELIGDKVLVFSQSLHSLTVIEEFLKKIDDETQAGTCLENLNEHEGSWSLGLDYFRLDGQTSPENRNIWCKTFNNPKNTRARLFLISTRAGGLGINLTAANRVIIFDASWNPSQDVQSIFRIYRFGQRKPCYVYRFLAAGTMEEKIYNRQVTKLSLSCRVVDEQQIERHYSNNDLSELYKFEPKSTTSEKRILNLPKDRLLAEMFLKYKIYVDNYHEHDSLLENKTDEELDDEERKEAWLEYEEEKKGKPMQPYMTLPSLNLQTAALLNQYNLPMSTNMTIPFESAQLQEFMRQDYPNTTPQYQAMLTSRTLAQMYNYWERETIRGSNAVQQQLIMNQQHNSQMQMAQQTAAHRPQMSMQMPQMAVQRLQIVQQMPHTAKTSANKQSLPLAGPSVARQDSRIPSATIDYRNRNACISDTDDNDIVEVPSNSSSQILRAPQTLPQSSSENKNQEE